MAESSIIVLLIFVSVKVSNYQSIHSIDLAGFLTNRTDTRQKFRAFQTSLSFLCSTAHDRSTLQRIYSVFQFNFSKLNLKAIFLSHRRVKTFQILAEVF